MLRTTITGKKEEKLRMLLPDAMVVPTPLRLVSVAQACSRFGSFRKAFLVSATTALGVLIRTRLVS